MPLTSCSEVLCNLSAMAARQVQSVRQLGSSLKSTTGQIGLISPNSVDLCIYIEAVAENSFLLTHMVGMPRAFASMCTI